MESYLPYLHFMESFPEIIPRVLDGFQQLVLLDCVNYCFQQQDLGGVAHPGVEDSAGLERGGKIFIISHKMVKY